MRAQSPGETGRLAKDVPAEAKPGLAKRPPAGPDDGFQRLSPFIFWRKDCQ